MTWSLGTFDVRDVALGSETALDHGRLSVNTQELRNILLEGNYFADVGIDIVCPEDDIRIVHIVDIVEPRVRVSNPGTDFPGLLGPPRTVGLGTTHRLRGITVMAVAPPLAVESVLHREVILDMHGEAARYSPFSALTHLVLSFAPNPAKFPTGGSAANVNVTSADPLAVEYNRAIRIAALRAAVYLAQVTRGLEPDHLTSFDTNSGSADGLPGVVYLSQLFSPYVYGRQVFGGGPTPPLPTTIHPNEVLDGAMVNSTTALGSMMDATYLFQNHAVLEELYAHHGRDLALKGMVLFSNGDSVSDKERVANYAANLAINLGAQGAILTYLGGGHPTVDTMMTCEVLEKRGVKTTLIVAEMAATPEDSALPHFAQEANAMISTGNYEVLCNLPPVSKVIGGNRLLGTGEDAAGALVVPLRRVLASTHKSGVGNLRAQVY